MPNTLLALAAGILSGANQPGASFGDALAGGAKALYGNAVANREYNLERAKALQAAKAARMAGMIDLMKSQDFKVSMSRQLPDGRVSKIDVPASMAETLQSQGWQLGETGESRLDRYEGEMTGAQIMRQTGMGNLDPSKVYKFSGNFNPLTGQRIIDPASVVGKNESEQRPMSQSELMAIKEKQNATIGAIQTYDTVLQNIENLKTHPGLRGSVGWASLLMKSKIPGTQEANFMADLEQIRDQVFLPAVRQMQGMGQLSDAEGRALSNSFSNLSSQRDVKSFLSTLDKFKRIVSTKRSSLQQMGSMYQQAIQAQEQGGSYGGGYQAPKMRKLRNKRTGEIKWVEVQ